MPDSIRQTIRNRKEDIFVLIGNVRSFLEEHGARPRPIYAVDLALEELLTNVCRHGYGEGEEAEIEVALTIDDRGIELVIEDSGKPFDPTAHEQAPVPSSLGEAPIGGLGIKMIRKMASAMEYQRTGDKNRLVVRIENGG